MYYSKTLDKIITDKVWRLVRIGSRPVWHIYGIKKSEYHNRMKKEGFLSKEADILIKDFKENKLKKLVRELRKLIAKVIIKCCRDGDVVYVPISKTFEVETIVDESVPIDTWKSQVILSLIEHIKETGNEKCQNMSGSLFLCKENGYEIKMVKTTRRKVL